MKHKFFSTFFLSVAVFDNGLFFFSDRFELEKTAPAIVRLANTPPLVVADMRSGFNNDLFFSDRFGLGKLELFNLTHPPDRLDYVLNVNLKDYGLSIKPPPTRKAFSIDLIWKGII